MTTDITLDFQIRNTWLRFVKLYNHAAAQFGSTMTIGFILLNIDQKTGTPSTQLGPLMGLESTSLTRPLKEMENRGLISRKKDPADKRVVRICLTPEGIQMRAISKKTVLDINNKIRAFLTDERYLELSSTLQQVTECLENESKARPL